MFFWELMELWVESQAYYWWKQLENNLGFYFEVLTPDVGEFEPKDQLVSYLSNKRV